MRVTQTEKAFSILEIKIPFRREHDENDPLGGNLQEGKCLEAGKGGNANHDHTSKKVNNLRRQYLKKIEQIQQKCNSQIQAIKKNHQAQKQRMTAQYQKDLKQKQEYIRLLQSMLSQPLAMIQTKKVDAVDESKYLYTENTKHYVPQYDEISDKIDFKLEPMRYEKKFSLDSKRLASKKRSTLENLQACQFGSNESSKHKLIPKGKPSESRTSTAVSKPQISSYSHCGNVKISRPFFL